jgi:ABC-type lipoprotein export system ATPase subunit
MRSDAPAAECREVVQIYPSAGGAVVAIRGITAAFEPASISVVVGPSGAGKSTLLRLVACLERPAAGDVVIAGTPTAALTGRVRRRLIARRIGYVFQRPAQNLLDYLTVAQHVDLAARMRAPGSRATSAALLDTAGLSGFAHVRPSELSAGERQRLAFAMAVAGDPAVVVADEPTAELDPDGAAALVELLPALVRRGRTFVIASHDPALVAAADRLLVVRDGTLAEQRTGDGEVLAVLDGAGRLRLPDAARDTFATGLVRITRDVGGYRITEP